MLCLGQLTAGADWLPLIPIAAASPNVCVMKSRRGILGPGIIYPPDALPWQPVDDLRGKFHTTLPLKTPRTF